jgi:predicted DNA-binding transcriptional regulator YafY
MDKFDRSQKLHRILCARRTPISLDDLAHELECDSKTVRRAIDVLQTFVFAPIIYDEERKGWRYERANADRFELSGLWLTSEELHGLAIIMQITQSMDSGLLGDDSAWWKKPSKNCCAPARSFPHCSAASVWLFVTPTIPVAKDC